MILPSKTMMSRSPRGLLPGGRQTVRHGGLPRISPSTGPFRGFRCMAAIINEAAGLYHCLSLGLHGAGLIPAAWSRGVRHRRHRLQNDRPRGFGQPTSATGSALAETIDAL
ncbi:hypothetical protein ACFPM2_24670 [Azospirillum picis]|nr:hypothetical protein [Azospirillum picis]